MRHLETRVAFVGVGISDVGAAHWVTEFHWVGSASKRGLRVGTCIFGFSYVRLRPQVPTPTFQKMPRARPSGPRVSVILKKGRQPGRHARFLGSELGRQNDVSGSAKSQSVHDLQ